MENKRYSTTSKVFQTLKEDRFPEKDEQLVWQRFISGDDQSLIHIYRKYVHVLFRYGQQFSRRHEFVEDCIQELFCELIAKRKRLSKVQTIKAYLFTSLKRKIFRDLKKQEKLQFDEDGFYFSFAELPISISNDLTERDYSIIFQKINLLPASQREIIFLYFYEGCNYSEIAEIRNVKIETARTLTYRALENLEKQLGPYLSSFYFLISLFS
ncbi:MAG: RNA polymerase sigma factor [Bacteroidota bacterium]